MQRQRAVTESLHLFVQLFCHLTDQTSGQILNFQTSGQFFHLARGHALHKSYRYHLNQRRLTSFALGNKKRNIAVLAHFGYHEIRRSHPCVQPLGMAAAAIPAAAADSFTFLCTQLPADLRFHKLTA